MYTEQTKDEEVLPRSAFKYTGSTSPRYSRPLLFLCNAILAEVKTAMETAMEASATIYAKKQYIQGTNTQ